MAENGIIHAYQYTSGDRISQSDEDGNSPAEATRLPSLGEVAGTPQATYYFRAYRTDTMIFIYWSSTEAASVPPGNPPIIDNVILYSVQA